jgi:hypothetical protein
MANLVELTNNIPIWDASLKKFGLHFNDRVQHASAKNIQFVDHQDGI